MHKLWMKPNVHNLKLITISYFRAMYTGLLVLTLISCLPFPTSARKAGLSLSGTSSYAVNGSLIDIKVEKIVNNRPAGSKSGSLRVSVWATKEAYQGGTINGYVLGRYGMEPLKGNYTRSNVSVSVKFNPPPKGTYCIVLTLDEYSDDDEWLTADYLTFKKLQTF